MEEKNKKKYLLSTSDITDNIQTMKNKRQINKNLNKSVDIDIDNQKDTTNKLEEEQKTLLKNSQEENKKLKETIYQLEQEKKTLIKNSQEENERLKQKMKRDAERNSPKKKIRGVSDLRKSFGFNLKELVKMI